jgi:hypothetical protein
MARRLVELERRIARLEREAAQAQAKLAGVSDRRKNAATR